MMKCWGKIKSFFRPKPEAKVEEPKPTKAPEKKARATRRRAGN